MNKLTSRLLCFVILLNLGTSVRVAAEEKRELAERATETVRLLASDEFGGRGVGTEGIDRAADYIAEQFSSMGLKTDVMAGGPFQPFTITSTTEMGDEANLRLAIDGPDTEEIKLKLGETFNPLALGGSGEVQGDLVFVGYGITAEKEQYDEYANVDVEGRTVILIRKEPQQEDRDSVFRGRRSSRHATFQRKVKNAVEHDAAAVIIVNDGLELRKRRDKAQESLDSALKRLTKTQDKFAKLDDPTAKQRSRYLTDIAKHSKEVQENAAALKADDFDEVLGFTEAGTRNRETIPVFFATRAAINPIIQSALGKSLDEMEAEIDEELVPHSAVLEGWQVDGQSEVIVKKSEIKNVVGVLEAEGPQAEETIVIGAHYDHLGMGGAGSLAPWTVDIHNGADDNASGTAALLEIARHFGQQGSRPKHRMVFIAFTGEERGLLGSDHYVNNPRYPLEDTIAMINLDMVGRLEENRLTVYGTGTAEEFDGMLDELNEEHQFELRKITRGFGPSDHSSFYGKKIPVLFFFTGMHNDYHRPGDDWDKINYNGIQRITQMTIDAIQRIDQNQARPTYVEQKRWLGFFSRSGSDEAKEQDKADDKQEEPKRGFLGVLPKMDADEEGFVIDDVVPDGPADVAGVKSGDIIIKVDDLEITDQMELRESLAQRKAGDAVKIVIRRDSETIEFEVKLGALPAP